MAAFDAPRATGPYGIATTPDGQVFFASLAGNYLGDATPRLAAHLKQTAAAGCRPAAGTTVTSAATTTSQELAALTPPG